MFTKQEQELAKEIDPKLPDIPSADDGNYAKEISIAALSTRPSDLDAKYWASIISGVLSRESNFGESLKPPGPSGTGDAAPRWRAGPPEWASRMGLLTGNSKRRSDGTMVYEIKPPMVGGATVAGWGYGLGQHDWEMGGRKAWIESGAYADPQENIMAAATTLAANYRLSRLRETDPALRYAIAMYNAGSAVLSDDDPDMRTTGQDYSEDVLRRAASFV